MHLVLSDSRWTKETLEALENQETGEFLDFQYSYYFARKSEQQMNVIRENKSKPRFFLDSGVFSARKKGEVIPTQDLIDFYHKHSDIVDYVFNMDEGPIETHFDNYKMMVDQGVPVIGIYHANMPLDYISRFIDYNPDFNFLAISTFLFNKLKISMDIFWEYIDKKNIFPTKVHALGVENFNLLARAPYYSADASTFVKAYIYGEISNFNKQTLKIDMIHPKKNLWPVIRKHSDGFKFIGSTAQDRDHRTNQCIHERFVYQRLLKNIWQERGIIWQD